MADSRKRAAKSGSQRRRTRTYMPAEERRKSIIAAAQTVFARANLRGARTRDIAAAAQINQATLFEHFPSKEALFDAAVMQPLIGAMQGVHERVEMYEEAKSSYEMSRMALDSARQNLAEMDEMFPLLVAALFSDPELGRALYREHLAPLIRQQGKGLEPVIRNDLDPDFVGLANFGMLFAIAMQRWFDETDKPSSDFADQLTKMATGGFARQGNADR